MGVYALAEGIELKGWRNMPYALVHTRKHVVQKISLRACLFLLACDGQTEQDDIPETASFERRGFIKRLDAPETELNASPAYTLSEGYFRRAVQLAITGRCNLHCRHCLAADGDVNVSTQLSYEECNHIFDELVENDIYELWITGGEPLVHPDFRSIFLAAVEHGLRVTSIYTNAWLIDEDLLDFIESTGQKPTFVVSFDGLGTHDWMRNCPGAQERTLAKIALLGQRGFSVRVGLNVNSVTAPGALDTCRTLVNRYGVKSLRLIYTSPTPRWDAALQGGIEPLAPGDYYDLMIELVRASRLEKWSAEVDVIHLPKLHKAPKNQARWNLLRTPPAPDATRPVMSCARANNVLFITSGGRVLPCSVYEGESQVLGMYQGDDTNVLKTPLARILSDSELTREFEVTVADLVKTYPECDGCAWLTICRGGCALYARGRTYIDMDNPLCTLYKDGYATKYLDMLEETEGAESDEQLGCAGALSGL